MQQHDSESVQAAAQRTVEVVRAARRVKSARDTALEVLQLIHDMPQKDLEVMDGSFFSFAKTSVDGQPCCTALWLKDYTAHDTRSRHAVSSLVSVSGHVHMELEVNLSQSANEQYKLALERELANIQPLKWRWVENNAYVYDKTGAMLLRNYPILWVGWS